MTNVLTQVDEGAIPARTKTDYEMARAGIHVQSVDEAITLAKVFAASGMFKDIKGANECVVKILMGREFGFTPVASMNNIHIVSGKMMLSGNAIGARIKEQFSHKYRYKVLEKSAETCRIEFIEKLDGAWESLGVEVFTAEDAKRQGTQNMVKFPANMLFNRAMANGTRAYAPDVFGGHPVYAEGELEEPVATPATSRGRADDIKARLTEKNAAAVVAAQGQEGNELDPRPDRVMLEETHALTPEQAQEIWDKVAASPDTDHAAFMADAIAAGQIGFSALLARLAGEIKDADFTEDIPSADQERLL